MSSPASFGIPFAHSSLDFAVDYTIFSCLIHRCRERYKEKVKSYHSLTPLSHMYIHIAHLQRVDQWKNMSFMRSLVSWVEKTSMAQERERESNWVIEKWWRRYIKRFIHLFSQFLPLVPFHSIIISMWTVNRFHTFFLLLSLFLYHQKLMR